MQRIETFPRQHSLFVFDLEFIGDVRKLDTCRIWEIAVYSVSTGQWFESVVDPDPTLMTFPPPPIPSIPQLTRAFLDKESARTWPSVFEALNVWIRSECNNGSTPIFISHNTFRADKPILEYECQRCSCQMPMHWYFFDSLHYSRHVVRNAAGNYSLSGLHMRFFNEPIMNVHRARSDVVACIRILQHMTQNTWQMVGPAYPTFSTSLRTIRWIGKKAEEVFYSRGISSVEELFMILHQRIRQDYLLHGMMAEQSIRQTLQRYVGSDLPQDNVNNIASVVLDVAWTEPFSQIFAAKTSIHLRSDSPSPK